MKQLYIIVLLLGFATLTLSAQYKVILEYNDGHTVEGKIKKFKSDAKTITIRDKKNKKVKVKSKELAKITIFFGQDTGVFKKERWANINGFYKIKNKKNLLWLAKFYDSDAIDGYIGYSNYNTWNNVKGFGLTSQKHGVVNYYIKRPNDRRVILIAQDVSENDPLHAFDKIMRRKFKSLVKKKCPKFVKALKKKKYKIEDIETMFDDYNKTCGK